MIPGSNGGKAAPWRAIVQASLLATIFLAGCQKEETPATDATATDEPAGAVSVASSVPAAPLPPPKPGEWSGTVAEAPAADEASEDLFVGWYFERGGAGRLLACGQSAPLEVADATRLRELKAKRGGGPEPVYVQLKVRLAPGSKLEVTSVQQFGVDEGPTPNCQLVPPG
jgi:hypothetical protein